MSRLPNLLVISDLHLGEDIGAHHDVHTDLDLVERQLTAFIEHHRDNLIGERPWRLIINGDMVDFLAMTLMPADVGILTGLDPDDHLYGLGTTAPAALAKMDAVLKRHAPVFSALASFVDAGNCLAIVIGNHDVEFHWRAVQQRLIESLAKQSTDPVAIRDRISFHPWFFWEEGVWVEHGHLYDPYCTIEDVLDPFTDDGSDLDPSLSGALMRYVNNHYAPHSGHAEPWSFGEYLWWFVRQGGWRMLDILGSFIRMTQRMLIAAATLSSPSRIRTQRRGERVSRLGRLAKRFSLDPAAVRAVDELTYTPVVVDRLRVIRSLMLDRLGLLFVALAILLGALIWTSWPIVGLTAAMLSIGLAYSQYRLATLTEAHVSTAQLTAVAAEIRRRVRAKVVVFGHTHDPVARRDAGGWTFNTGSWVPDGEHRAFTHLRIVRGSRQRLHATLRRWTDGHSVPFVPSRARTG